MSRPTDHKEGKATVKVVYYKQKTLKDGSHPFMVRITRNGKLKYVSIGHSLHPQYWNERKKEIRKSYPDPQREELLLEIERWEKRYSEAAAGLAAADLPHEATTIANAVLEKRKDKKAGLLLAYTERLESQLRQAGQNGNADVYHAVLNRLKAFLVTLPGTPFDISFSEVTVKFCNGFETWLRGQEVSENTMHNRFRTLRSIFNRAIAEGDANVEDYPFARTVAERHKYVVSKFDTTTRKRAMNRDDVAKIESFVPVGTHVGAYGDLKNRWEVVKLQRAKDVFLFSYYLAGINFVDVCKLRWKNLVRGTDGAWRVEYSRQKTKGKLSIVVLPPAMAIVESYRTTTHNHPDDYIFPILDRHIHQEAKSVINRLKKMLGEVNDGLKLIAARCGIESDLTTYVARHSFGTNLRQAGVPDAVTSKLYGHKTERQTTVYLDDFGTDTTDQALAFLLPKNKKPDPEAEPDL